MIYLFDDTKTLIGTVRPKHTIALLYERERNGLYTVTSEFPVKYNERGTIYNYYKKANKADFLGHYDREGRFQLHKIAAVEVDGANVLVKGIHIFFDEAKAGAIIREKRYRGRSADVGAREMLLEIGWNLVDYDPSPPKDYSFYNVSPLEARQIILDKFALEFDYWLDFDGKKVTNKQVALKTAIGEKTSKRYTYGSNVLSIRAEQDYSEVYTAVIGRGKGEEYEDTGGYGRRIEFTDVTWRKPNNPLDKPSGERILIDPAATQLFGYKEDGTVSPRVKVEVFSDIEDPTQLLNESYAWLMENNTPKAVFSVDVADGDGLNLGDEVYVIYRDIDLVKPARVSKVIDDLISGDRDVEFGDVAYFNTDRRLSGIDAKLSRVENESASVIYRMKLAFDERFDEQVKAIEDAYEQALIDANANIEAAEVRMAEELDAQRKAMIDNIESAEQAAKDAAARNLAETTERINTTIETNRTEMETDIQNAKQEAIRQAESDAKAKADSVQSNLDSFKVVHQQLYDDVTADIMDIDDFLGDISNITLDERLQEMNLDFEDRINNININTANMLQGTRFDEPGKINTSIGGTEVLTTSDINRIRIQDDTGYVSRFAFKEPVKLEANTDYFVTIEYRTFTVPEIDYFAIETPTGYVRLYSPDTGKEGFSNLVTDGVWNQATLRLNEPVMLQGRLHIGTRPSGDNDGVWIDVRQPYMTNTSNRRWLPHPNDATQSIEQITRRITELEDGREELITRSEYDFDTGQVNQTIRDIEERVDVSRNMIVDIENYDVIKNGSEVMQTVRGFNQKVWDSASEIGANLIPMSANAWENGIFWSSGSNNNNSSGIRTKEYIEVIPGEQYTFQDESAYVSSILEVQIAQWDGDTRLGISDYVNRGSSRTFTAQGDRIRIGLTPIEGFGITPRFIDHVDERIQMKLEKGSTATPMMNAISHIEQLANRASIAVQSIEGGDVLTQSDLIITADYWQLGSKRVDGDTVASVLRGTPGSIDAIVDEMNLTGNLNVKGQIESISMSAVEAEFANLFASELSATTIDVDHISGKNGWFESQYIMNANIKRLAAQHVFTDAIHAKSLDAIEANFGRVQTAILKADVIENMHLSSNSVEVDNIRMTHALAEKIMANTVMTNTVKAMSVDAVYADLRKVNSEIMTSNIIKSNWLNVDTALFNRFTASSAFISSLTAKTAFIRDIQSIEINTSQLNVSTIMEQGGKIAGGISIRRPDGAYAVNNGMLRNEYVVNAYDPNFMTQTPQGLNAFYQSGEWWVTSRRVVKDAGKLRFNAYQFVHSARYLEIEIGYRRHQTDVFFEIDSFGSYSFNKTYSQFQGGGGSTEYHLMKVDLGVPDYRRKSFYFYAYPNSSGDESAQMWFRILRVVQTDF